MPSNRRSQRAATRSIAQSSDRQDKISGYDSQLIKSLSKARADVALGQHRFANSETEISYDTRSTLATTRRWSEATKACHFGTAWAWVLA
jgi:hypothetical protein